jgi:hypothetical protein
VAVLRRVCREAPRPIRAVNPDIPAALCRLIERLHAKRPADRPASAREVADRLAELLADLNSGRSRLPSGTLPGRGPARQAGPTRHRSRWAAAALVVLLVGLGMSEATGVTDVRGTVIHLFSPEGTLVVEVDDPKVSVAVDGGDVVITGAGAREIRLKPGQYKVEASKDGQVVRQELVTVTHDGRRVVRIGREVEPTEAERWERSVARLPAAQQVQEVALRLQKRNPGFDGKVTPTIENGVVTGMRFNSDEVEDVSPLRALPGLVTLDCPGTFPRKGKLSDLTPLAGLRLTHLDFMQNPVADLGPLRGMPLTVLLAGDSRVSDLSPLSGKRLEVLTLQSTAVTDLSTLRGMPLRWLDLCRSSGISDLGILKDLPLEYLNLTALPVSDLSLVGGLKTLKWLVLDYTPVSDLTPLRGLGLTRLAITGTRVKDLSSIQGLPLTLLALDYRPEYEGVVRSLKGLETINNKPAADFWKEVGGK